MPHPQKRQRNHLIEDRFFGAPRNRSYEKGTAMPSSTAVPNSASDVCCRSVLSVQRIRTMQKTANT